ncbi:MAG: thioredoxin domain-containing protein [Acidobacteria bacterium]|nr:thioredoxin domain-containing protein [Acidobacteriota bacterium]
MSTTTARLALICALVGLGAAGTAAWVHYRMFADPTYTSFCDVSTTVSCTQVYASRFGTFKGVSVSVFGGIWFAFAALLSVAGMTARPSVRESIPGYLFAASTLALAVILYLGYASFVILKLVCVLCLITYAAVIGLFLISGAATSFPMLSLPRRAVQDLKVLVSSPMAIALAVLWIGGAVSTLALFPREASAASAAEAAGAGAEQGAPAAQVSQAQQTELERFMASAPRVPLVVPNDGAKVLVVKFADYQCPACAQAYEAYKPIFAKYAASNPGQVKLVMKDFPLNSNCNPAVRTQMHAGACDAAVAVRLAAATGKAEQLEDYLYSHQQGMTPETVRQAAKDIAGITDIDTKYAQTLELVKGDIAMGQQLKVNQTPTFFINGVKIDGAWAPQFFDQAIAYELAHAK